MEAALETSRGPLICAGYFSSRDDPGEPGVTAVALCDDDSQYLAGHVVDAKGASSESAVKQVLKDLRKMGHHGKIVVKTDQESSIIDLFKAVAKERGAAGTILETAARSDSKGNGKSEKAVQSIEETVRTLMIDLELRCGEKMPVLEPFFPWLLEHACDLLNKYKVRRGNRTAWEYLRGKPYSGEVYPFGTPVLHMIMRERWFDGLWLGIQFTSGEHMVATPDGRVIRARAVHPRPDTLKITKEALVNI